MRTLRIFPSNGGVSEKYAGVKEITPGARETICFKLADGLAVSVSKNTDWILVEKADDETPDRG